MLTAFMGMGYDGGSDVEDSDSSIHFQDTLIQLGWSVLWHSLEESMAVYCPSFAQHFQLTNHILIRYFRPIQNYI